MESVIIQSMSYSPSWGLTTDIQNSQLLHRASTLKVFACANTFYSKVNSNYEYVDIDNGGWANNSNLLVNILPSKTTDIQLQYFVSTPQYYPQFTASALHHMTVGVKQRMLKGKMNLSVLLTDVFNTYKWDIYSYNRIFDLTNVSRNKSRMLWLGISYNLNSFKPVKKVQKQELDRSKIKL